MHWKKSLLVIHKILRLFLNTLTVNDKNYPLNRDTLTLPIHMQLSRKQKTFSQFFFVFLKSIINFWNFDEKRWPSSWCISGNNGFKKYAWLNVQKAVFQRTLRQKRRQMGVNTVTIWMAEPLQYLLITGKVVTLEKVSFSDTQNPKSVC